MTSPRALLSAPSVSPARPTSSVPAGAVRTASVRSAAQLFPRGIEATPVALCVALVAWAVLAVSAAPVFAARPLDFEKIIDTRSPLSTGGFFLHLNSLPVLSGEDVAFSGLFTTASGENRSGIQARLGGIRQPIADTATRVPGRPADFVQFGPPSIHAGQVVFTAEDSDGGDGVYAWKATLRVVADSTTPAPGGERFFTDFASPKTSGREGEVTAFLGLLDNAVSGVYQRDGTVLTRVSDSFTPVPGGQGNAFVDFSAPALDGRDLAFAAFGRLDGSGYSEPGLYAWRDGRLIELIGPNAAIPGKSGRFTEIGAPSLSAGDVAFRGFGPTPEEEGIYLLRNGQLGLIANDLTVPPGASLRFRSFESVSLSNGAYAFTGRDLYGVASVWSTLGTESGETMRRVVGPGDVIDGKTAAGAACSSQALDGDRLAVWVEFTDGSQGIFLAKPRAVATPPVYSVLIQSPYDGQTVRTSSPPPALRAVLRDEAGRTLTAANLSPSPLLAVSPAGSCSDQRLQAKNGFWEYDFSACRLAPGLHELSLLSGDPARYALASPPLAKLDLTVATRPDAAKPALLLLLTN